MSNWSSVQPIEILLVEDNPGDVRLTREALDSAKIHNALHVVDTGEEALAFLRREAPHERAARPDLVLLDLNLPVLSGQHVLEAIKGDPALASIPVVVLAATDSANAVRAAYEHHANGFVSKPIDTAEFCSIVQRVERFWLQIVKLPPR